MVMSMTSRWAIIVLSLLTLGTVVAPPARAEFYSLAASGTISSNTTGDATIPVGTPWTFEFVYNAAAPDDDLDVLGFLDEIYGIFNNTTAPPAMVSFHYQAGGYEVTLDDPADFGELSGIVISASAIHAIDLSVEAPALFPPLAGGPVSFYIHLGTSSSLFGSDALPTDVALGLGSFDESVMSLQSPAGFVRGLDTLTSLAITVIPEPSTAALGMVGLLALLVRDNRRSFLAPGAGYLALAGAG